MDNDYNRFAPYYRLFIQQSGHLKNEQNTLEQIIREINIPLESRILDAACGTGDALYYLYRKGFRNLTGVDVSTNMIDQARQLLSDISYYNCSWIDIERIVSGSFNLLFIISISILHVASIEEFNTVIKSFYNILDKTGILVLDNRYWINKNGTLIETNRGENHKRCVSTFDLENNKIIIYDNCKYERHKQIIEYTISDGHSSQTIEVKYFKITTHKIIEILTNAGFSRVLTKKYSTWPYELIFAFK